MAKRPPVSAKCSTHYRAAHDAGPRALSEITDVVMHCTQGATAQAAASWFANPDSAGSAHLCVDDAHCFRTLSDNRVPWAAPGANTQGVHIEMAGFAAWDAAMWWGRHRWTIERAAYKAARYCHVYGIPPKFRKAADLKAGKHGVTTHAECSKAFGGDHTDPGPLWPRRRFMRRVRAYYAQMEAAT